MSDPGVDHEKRALRASMRALTRVEDAAAEAGAVASVVRDSEVFQKAPRIAIYAALRDEVPTRQLFDAIVGAGKTALFPRCTGDTLEFAATSSWAELVEGAFGTLEPPPGARIESPGSGDLALVPGLAFDLRGARLGRGRGFYDRAFAGGGVPFLCGLAYAAQVVDRVPTAEHDVRMNAVATPSGWHVVADAASRT